MFFKHKVIISNSSCFICNLYGTSKNIFIYFLNFFTLIHTKFQSSVMEGQKDISDVIVMDVGEDGDWLAQNEGQPHNHVPDLVATFTKLCCKHCQGYLHRNQESPFQIITFTDLMETAINHSSHF